MERYLGFAEYCTKTFGRKLYRVALDAGMTCPNRDGTLGSGGCIFCGGTGSGDFTIRYEGQKLTQEDLIYNHQNASPGDYIAYFQNYTNTYAKTERLEHLFSSALADPLFAGISVATRPDCVPPETLELLVRLKQEYPEKFIWVELGLQTAHEKTAEFIRRGYPLSVYDDCVRRLHEAGIPVITHVILGLPGESEEMMIETIRHLNKTGCDGVKLQLLHYLSDSDLGRLYEEDADRFRVLSLEEYCGITAECIGHLKPDTVIHRITGDGSKDVLLAPLWSLDKRNVINRIRHEMKVRGITQGCRL